MWKRFVPCFAVAAVAMLAIATASMAAPVTGTTTCTGDLSGQTILTNVTVPAGGHVQPELERHERTVYPRYQSPLLSSTFTTP